MSKTDIQNKIQTDILDKTVQDKVTQQGVAGILTDILDIIPEDSIVDNGDGTYSVESGENSFTIDTNVDVSGINAQRVDYTEIDSSRSVAFIGLIGQSNGDGTELLPLGEEITSLNNVYILNRSTTINGLEWTNEDSWGWSNFTSQSNELNLGNDNQNGHYKNFTTEFAREWQNRINNGEDLPDLYLFHMSWSGNGFGLTEQNLSRYNPTSPTYANVRSNIWTGSIMLHKWALNNLIENNNIVIHLGLNNNQWEHDSKYQNESENYIGWIQSLLSEHDKIAGTKIPFTYFNPATNGADGRFVYNENISEDLNKIKGRLVTKLDAKELSTYDESIISTSGYRGVFNDDVHYSSATFDGLENQFWNKGGHKGIVLSNAYASQMSELELFNFISEITEVKTYISANEFNEGYVLDFYLMENVTSSNLNQDWHVVKEGVKKYFSPLVWQGAYNFWFFESIPNDTINSSIVISNIKSGTPINYHGIFCANKTTDPTFRDSGYNYISIGVSADTSVIPNSENKILIWDISTGTILQSFQDVLSSDPAYNLLGFGTTTGTTIDTDLKISLLNINGNNYARIEYREWSQENINPWVQIGTDIAITLPTYSQNGGKVGLINGLGNVEETSNGNIRFAKFEVINLE